MAVETFDLEKTTKEYLKQLMDNVGYFIALRIEEHNMESLVVNLQISANILNLHLKHGFKYSPWYRTKQPILICSLCEQP